MRKNFDELGMLITSLLFGFSFSIQAIGAKHLDPFSFSIGKYIIAIITTIPFILRKTKTSRKDEIIYGIILGLILFGFTNLQQVVAKEGTPGKTGFITSLYIVEVPLINFLFFKKKISLQTIISLLFSIAGLVLISDLKDFSIKTSDILTIVCSLLLASQIIVLGKCSNKCNVFKLNFYSFVVILLLSIFGYFIAGEQATLAGFKNGWFPILYVGFGCSTIGCGLQAYCQKTLDPTTTSLILSLESVFSVISGYLILDATLSKIEIVGCILMFIGVILCITDQKKTKKTK